MNTLNNASLFVKTVVGFIVSVLFIGFVGYKSVESLDTFAGKADVIYSNDLTGLGILTVVQMEFLSARIALREALITSDPAFRDKRLTEFNKHVEVLKDSSRSYLTKLRSEEGKKLYVTYEADLAAFEEVGRSIAALVQQGNKDSATFLTLTACVERSDRVKDDLGALLENKQEVSSQARGELMAIPVDLAGDQTLISVLAAVLSLSVGLFLAAIIVRPVKKLTTAAEAIAGGDLNYAVEANRSKDEIGRLASAFSVMVENLRARVTESNAKGEEAERAASEAKVLRRNAEVAQADLSRSVDEMLASVDRFAQGDLTASVEAEGKDSIRELFDRYNRAIDNVRTMIQTISSQVQVVQGSSLDISQKSSVLATGIEHQSLQVADISSAMMEMNTTITENSRMASAAAQEAQEAKNEAQRGGESLKMMIENVGQVSAVVRNSSAIVSQLGDSSQRIGEIVSVIEEIADQTNLLALNAAIEAARAGDQGRGFAVVADEVRKLAERTQGATKEIGGMIGEIQKNTSGAVSAMQTGSKLVDSGESHINSAKHALEVIIQKSAYVADYVATLATASEEQSATSEEITRSVESISSVVEQSATTTQEIASIAGDLHALTEELNALMLQFKTGDNVSGRLPSRSAALPGRR